MEKSGFNADRALSYPQCNVWSQISLRWTMPCCVTLPSFTMLYIPNSLVKLRLNETYVQLTEIVRPWNVPSYHSVSVSSLLAAGWLVVLQADVQWGARVCTYSLCFSNSREPFNSRETCSRLSIVWVWVRARMELSLLTVAVRLQGCARFPEFSTFFSWTQKKLGVQVPGNIELKIYFCNFTSISLVLFLHVLPTIGHLQHCVYALQETTTKYELKLSWNWEFYCERKKTIKHKLHKILRSLKFCKKNQLNENTPEWNGLQFKTTIQFGFIHSQHDLATITIYPLCLFCLRTVHMVRLWLWFFFSQQICVGYIQSRFSQITHLYIWHFWYFCAKIGI